MPFLVRETPAPPTHYTRRSGILPTDFGLEDVAQPALDRLVRLFHVFIRQGLVVRLVAQGVRQTLRARRDAVAVVKVEQPDVAQQVAAAGADLRLDALGRRRLVHDDGYVPRSCREARHRLEG